jgi:hypothetical protein
MLTVGKDDLNYVPYMMRKRMPSTVTEIFAAARLVPKGVVQWGKPIPETASGVYVVSLSSDANECAGCLARCPVATKALQTWLSVCPNLSLDGKRPAVAAIKRRLSEFWLPDEVIVYIGLATSLRGRVGGYYRTPLGARKPHAGGHFLKTLNNLTDLFVHYAPARDPDGCEGKMLNRFCQNVSRATKSLLRDPDHPFPFANLEYPPGTRKRHGLLGTRA